MKVDTLIIGSGVVATALTKRLLEHTPQMSILILEAGNRIQDQGLRHLGGLPGHGGASPRLQPQIFDLPYPDRDSPGENR